MFLQKENHPGERFFYCDSRRSYLKYNKTNIFYENDNYKSEYNKKSKEKRQEMSSFQRKMQSMYSFDKYKDYFCRSNSLISCKGYLGKLKDKPFNEKDTKIGVPNKQSENFSIYERKDFSMRNICNNDSENKKIEKLNLRSISQNNQEQNQSDKQKKLHKNNSSSDLTKSINLTPYYYKAQNIESNVPNGKFYPMNNYVLADDTESSKNNEKNENKNISLTERKPQTLNDKSKLSYIDFLTQQKRLNLVKKEVEGDLKAVPLIKKAKLKLSENFNKGEANFQKIMTNTNIYNMTSQRIKQKLSENKKNY